MHPGGRRLLQLGRDTRTNRATRRCGAHAEAVIFSNPGESDARDALDRIYAIDAKRKLATAEAAAKREQENSPQARESALLKKVEGAKFVNDSNKAPSPHFSYSEILEIKDRTLYKSIQIYSMGSGNQRMISFQDHYQAGLYSAERVSYHDSAFTVTSYGETCIYRIREDGKALSGAPTGGQLTLMRPFPGNSAHMKAEFYFCCC